MNNKRGLWHKFLDYLGFGPEEEWEEEELSEDEAEVAAADGHGLAYQPVKRPGDRPSDRPGAVTAKAPVVPITAAPTQRQAFKVLLVEPRSFEEVQTIADQLRARRPVILNLEHIEKENKDVAQRILNFLSGATYALGGASQRVSNAIFFFAPQGVDVSTLGRGFTGTAIGGGSSDTALAELLGQMQIERFSTERKGSPADPLIIGLRRGEDDSRSR
jgi:cell division inhibitor SepF